MDDSFVVGDDEVIYYSDEGFEVDRHHRNKRK